MTEKIRVLYVDDEADLLDIGKLFLEESGEFTVTTAMSAPEGIRLLEQEKFDAIISDYQMPDMDGIQFLVEVRSRFGPIPFILFTGRGREEVVIQAINSGADFYLQKGGEPGAQFAELMHKVKSAALRNRAEDSLRKSEEKYRQLIELSNEVILVAQDGMLKLVNHRLIELLGYSEQELLSTPFPVFIHPDDRAMVVERYQKRLKCEEFPSRYSFRLNPKDGNTLWLEISAVVIDWDGRPATLNFLTDITERKRADDLLREEQQFSKLLLDSLPGIFYLYTYPENRMVRWNKQHETLLGYTAEEIKGKLGTDLHLPEHKDAVLKAIDEVMEKGQSSVESTLLAKDGRLIPFFFTGVRFETPGQLYFMGIGIDISELKRVEEALRKNTEELHASYEQLTASEDELRQNVNDLSRTEQALRESEEKFHSLYLHMIEGAALHELTYNEQGIPEDYIIIETNPAFERQLGLSRDAIIGKTSREAYGLNEPPFLEIYARVALTGNPEIFETYFPPLAKHFSISAYSPGKGRFATIFEDITERKLAGEALKESEERFRLTLDAVNDGIWDWDIPTGTAFFSPRWYTMLGYAPDEMPGSYATWRSLIHPEDIGPAEQIIQDHTGQGEGNYRVEFRMRTKDGSWKWILTRGQVVEWDADNKPVRMVGTHTDITERKRAEEAIVSAQQRLNEAHSLAHIGTWDWVIDTDTVTWSEELCNIAGWDPLLPAPTYAELPRIYSPTSWDLLSNAVTRALTTSEQYNLELEMIRPDGSIRWTNAFGGVNRDENGKVIGLHGTVQDITDRKQVEEVLVETNEYLNNLFDYANAPIIVWDPNFVITRFNHAFEDLTLISAQEIIGQRLDILFPKESRNTSLLQIKKTLDGERWETVEIPILVKDGSVRTVLWNSANILDTHGRIISTIAHGVDITEGNRAEAALAESFATFKTVMDSLDALVYVADMKTYEILFVNQYGRKIWGDLTGKICWESLQVDQNGPCPFCTNEKLLDSEGNPAGIMIWEFKNTINGHWYECHDSAIRWTDGRIVRIEIATDITDRKQVDEVLRGSEERFRGLVDTITSGVAIYEVMNDGTSGKDYIIKDFNKTALEIEGKTKDKVLGRSLFDLRPAIDEYGLIPVFQQVWKTGVPGFFPQKVYIDEKYSSWYENRVFRLQSGEIVAVYDEVTERKRAEESLKISQLQLAKAMDLAHMVNWEFDATTGIFTFDDRFYAFYGTTAELEGGNQMPADVYAKKFVHPDDQHLVAVEVNKAIQATDPGYVAQLEHRIIRRDGEIRNIVVRFRITKDENGRTIKTHGANQDITDRKRVEEALQHLTEFQESIITNARVWLSVLDKSGKILIWNSAAEEISGYRSEEVIGYNEIWKKIYPDKEYRKQITDTINRIIRDKNYLENFETTILSKGGTKKVISWNTRGIPDATGNVSDYIAIGVDVTDRIRAEELRHESERRMTDIISFLPDATLVIDKNGIVLAWNRAMEEMTGVPAEQMIGKGNYEYALPFYHERRPITVDLVLHDDPAIVAKYPFMQKEGRSRRSELFIPHLNNGSGAYLWFKASPLYDGDGNLTGAIESIRDITERKVAEVAIQKNKETYRELVESISDVIFEIDCDGKITYISPVVQKVLEFEPEEMTGKNFIGFVYPDDRNLLNRRFSDLSDGIEHPTDYRVTTKSGNIRWVRTQTKPIMMEKTFCGARGTLIDITLRKVAEEALRESKALTDAVVENVPLMIFLKEATDLRFVIFNKAGEELLGYDRKALLGKNNLDLFPPEQAAHFMAKDREVLDGEAGMLDIPEESILTAKKGLRLLHTRKVCIRGGDGTTKFLLGISEDITERKELEKETENHTQELLKFSSSLAAANKKLNLLSSITRHDINNQMTVLQGYLAILKKKQPDPALIEYLQKSTIAAQRISSMIRFTKEYESIGVAAPVWQDCRIVVDTAAKETPLGQIIVNVDLPAGCEVFADPLIVKVFYNLMDNAVRYGGKITTIRFSVEEQDGDQIIVCEDDGEGVPAEEKEKIFERGFGKNTGMGLFLAREILDITGITIRETGEPGKGARFEMTVPKGAWRTTEKGA